jgi:DAK2 domain fusion protein YloV
LLESLDADAVRRWYRWGLSALEAARAEIDSLNVFPVADADTGTNLYLTLRSAVEAADDERAQHADLAVTATTMARLCLLGARGSSGVILSQLLRGVADVLAEQRRPPRGRALTLALERAVELAYGAVSQPVEGTMLTVARVAAEAARATESDDLAVVVDAAATAAHEALALTPSQLDVLGRAGVVDAGGRGIVVLIDVLKAVVDGRELPLPVAALAEPILAGCDADSTQDPAYEVMYLIDADDERIPALRAALDEIGDSAVVSGGGGLWNVHVHTDNAAAAVDLGAVAGVPHDVRVTEIGDHSRLAREVPPTGRLVVVALPAGSAGSAIRDVLANAGVHVVDASSVGDALATLRASELVVLVDGGPTVAASVQQAVAALPVRAVVVQVEAPVQLLSAVAVHDAHRPLEDDAAAMAHAAAHTRHIAVGPATADMLCADALSQLERLLADGGELVTVVSAAAIGARIADELAATRADIDVNQIAVDSLDSVVWLGVE